MGVDYTPISLYGVRLTLPEARAIFDEHVGGSEDEFCDLLWGEPTVLGLSMLEAGSECYGGEARYYIGLDLGPDTSLVDVGNTVAMLAQVGVFDPPEFISDIYVH